MIDHRFVAIDIDADKNTKERGCQVFEAWKIPNATIPHCRIRRSET